MAMSTRSRLPLNSDLMYHIFTFLPSFSCIQPLLLSSKNAHVVFTSFKASITRSIAYTQIGPALPLALRLIRSPSEDSKLGDDWNVSDIVIQPFEAKQLARNAEVAWGLEDLLSSRHKDRTLLSSSLTPAESYNFHRALYHFWIYVEIFGGLTGVEEFLQHVEDGEIETELDLEPTRTARKTWLERLSTDDLKQMSAVVKFLVDLSASTARGDMTLSGIMDGTSDRYAEVALSIGPSAIYDAYLGRAVGDLGLQDASWSFLSSWDEFSLVSGFFSIPSKRIWEDRGLDAKTGESVTILFDEVIGTSDACEKCNVVHGIQLYNHINWTQLRGLASTCTPLLPNFLKGRLRQNLQELPLLMAEISSPSFSYQEMLEWILGQLEENKEKDDLEMTASVMDGPDIVMGSSGSSPGSPIQHTTAHGQSTSTVISADTDTVMDSSQFRPSRQTWLCVSCIAELLTEWLWKWFLERKRASGVPIPEDCWYGYNCRTQTHKLQHANRLNHLCEQTRGDP